MNTNLLLGTDGNQAMAQQNTDSAHGIALRVDGAAGLGAETVAALQRLCDRAEDGALTGPVVLHVSGVPVSTWADRLALALVNKWERALRRFECLPAPTVAVAEGDCAGPALDALLATDYRIAAGKVTLAVPADRGALWPGMALYRLVQQSAAPAAVRRTVLFGETLDTEAALAAQLLDETAADLDGALAAAAARGRDLAGPELAVRRRLLFEAGNAAFDDALGAHLAACDRMLRRAAAEVAA